MRPRPGHEPGLESRLLAGWPWFVLAGTVLPVLLAALIRTAFPEVLGVDEHKRLLVAWFTLAGAVVFYWTMLITLAFGCWIVRVMKGPVREGDAYPLPKQDLFEV